jgi:hypothetical protein
VGAYPLAYQDVIDLEGRQSNHELQRGLVFLSQSCHNHRMQHVSNAQAAECGNAQAHTTYKQHMTKLISNQECKTPETCQNAMQGAGVPYHSPFPDGLARGVGAPPPKAAPQTASSLGSKRIGTANKKMESDRQQLHQKGSTYNGQPAATPQETGVPTTQAREGVALCEREQRGTHLWQDNLFEVLQKRGQRCTRTVR